MGFPKAIPFNILLIFILYVVYLDFLVVMSKDIRVYVLLSLVLVDIGCPVFWQLRSIGDLIAEAVCLDAAKYELKDDAEEEGQDEESDEGVDDFGLKLIILGTFSQEIRQARDNNENL